MSQSKDWGTFWVSLITWQSGGAPLTDQMFKIPRSTHTASRASASPFSPLGPRGCGILGKASCVLVTSAMRREVGRAGGPQPFPVLKAHPPPLEYGHLLQKSHEPPTPKK